MKKLELKHIAPYLPYGLQVKCYNNTWDIDGYRDGSIKLLFLVDQHTLTSADLSDVKPLLRPLSTIDSKEVHEMFTIAFGEFDFGKIKILDGVDGLCATATIQQPIMKDGQKILSKTIMNITVFEENIALKFIRDGENLSTITPIRLLNFLFSKHFDVFGLIGHNLAIEKS